MAFPLTFGFEIEFLIGAVVPDTIDPNPGNPRFTHFIPSEEKCISPGDRVFDHVRASIIAAGFPVSETGVTDDCSKWSVTHDSSIKVPVDSMYYWTAMEITSPAYYFSSKSLQAVSDMLEMLSSAYVVSVNESTGLHVHVGNGKDSFPYHVIRNLGAILWTFAPQLDSLHPLDRVGNTYCKSIRTENRIYNPDHQASLYSSSVDKDIMEIYKLTTVRDFSETFHERYITCNFTNLIGGKRSEPTRTVEFRQHEATFDTDRVLNWISTCHGITAYVQTTPPSRLFALLSLAKHEHWQKPPSAISWDDGLDAANRILTNERHELLEWEASKGPIMAESKFTVIDFLLHIGLHEQADFYASRWRNGDQERDGSTPCLAALPHDHLISSTSWFERLDNGRQPVPGTEEETFRLPDCDSVDVEAHCGNAAVNGDSGWDTMQDDGSTYW